MNDPTDYLAFTPAAPADATPAETPAAALGPRPFRPLAIVGMACRLPGADSPEAFWDNLVAGRESVRDLTPAELAGLPEALRNHADHVARTGAPESPYAFDAAFFGYTPREAELMDPQQRLLLECAWRALEHAGLAPGGRTGVYAGLASNSYFAQVLMSDPALRARAEDFDLRVAADKDFAATRVAFKLDLTGPAMAVQAACSSSGVALHLAARALDDGECDTALVGGARVAAEEHGYLRVEGGALSADGRVRPFDASASGMLLSSGAAMLVVKRLADAEAENLRVYAVLRGTALNNDGADKAGYTAPAARGQEAAIRGALAAAGVDADSVGYVEAHGTGTPVGDPIEVASLARVYGQAGPVVLGSAKSNVGHLDAAAAAVGAMKTALVLAHGEIPGTVHYTAPNPEIDFGPNLYVSGSLLPWMARTDHPRRAALSSFGFGGTNFHAVFEEAYPAPEPGPRPGPSLVKLSARTPEALESQAGELADWLDAHPDARLDAVARTLDTGRARFAERLAVVATDATDAALALREPARRVAGRAAARPRVAFLFPGQGAQHPGMGQRLYDTEPVFRGALDTCAEVLLPLLGTDIRRVLYATGAEAEGAAEALKATSLAQPAIFAVSYATAKLWQSLGVTPDVMIGHSVGEYVAAVLAGVFRLADALAILAERARLMQSMPPGAMMAVRGSEAQVQKYLADDVALAAINAPQLSVVAGPREALARVAADAKADGLASIPLHTSHAFHSAMMEPVVEPFRRAVADRPAQAPDRLVISTLTGEPLTAEQATDPAYWARQMRQGVRFAPALETALAHFGELLLLECGPSQNLTTNTRQSLKKRPGSQALASLPHAGTADADDAAHFHAATARLWTLGVEGRPPAGPRPRPLPLPGYPFARTVYRLAPHREASNDIAPSGAPPSAQATPDLSTAPGPDIAPLVTPPEQASGVLPGIHKIFAEITGLEFGAADAERTFLDLGLDSLLLTQAASRLKAGFKVELKFRQLMEDLNTPARLAAWLEERGAGRPGLTATAARAVQESNVPEVRIDTGAAPPRAFGAGARISREQDEFTPQQRVAFDALVARYVARTGQSKAFAQAHRAHLADPRTVSGFRPALKELVYPIVTPTSLGSKLWDLDGNEYVDITCGFGSVFFGHRAGFVIEAVEQQLRHHGYEIGPQTPLAGEVAAEISRFVGLPRVAFCATGSEAVLAAMRCARTVTGRNLVVMFNGDYHGVFDEVIFRGTPSLRTVPAAPGIPPESVANTLILDFGTARTLEILRERADDIAAIVLEPVQSRRPDFQPRDFIQELRRFCDASGAALVFDEIVTGFRAALGGAQEYYGIKADMGTYGKVLGGGLPIGVIAGTERFLDALDGGAWRFGDDSVPEVGVTYFAGTFVRHPLALAAAKSVCQWFHQNPGAHAKLNRLTARLVETINLDLQKAGAPLHIAHFTSLFKPEYTTEQHWGDLLYVFLREAGVHVWDGRPCFLTTAHTEADCERVVEAFRYAVARMQDGGFFDGTFQPRAVFGDSVRSPYTPPLPGARVGRDPDGNAAWFVPDPSRAGAFQKIEIR